jgi:glycosyltransferase involved in cell wall biosynthesis
MDAEAMTEAIITLLTDDALRMRLRRNAAEEAQRRFTLNRQVEAYLGRYEELIRK